MKSKKLNKKVITLVQFGSKNMNQAPMPTRPTLTDPTTSTITVVTTY